ncbi:hypothetical protein RJ640_012234 [Escallonia rubra]|uniref:Uncharacterized protein n=1 Tax=Escallonia rubra TaxID=112253 RepID=A0AA88R0G5_9ASTE|nr:hypothetical protein RJ640_012234 [Escallonia rubra]
MLLNNAFKRHLLFKCPLHYVAFLLPFLYIVRSVIESMGKHQADFDLPTVRYEDIQLCKKVKEIVEELRRT